MKKVLFYTNQFFGQIGGEAEAYQKPFIGVCSASRRCRDCGNDRVRR